MDGRKKIVLSIFALALVVLAGVMAVVMVIVSS